MTSFTAQVRNWTDKAKRNVGLVIGDAAQGVFADMTERQPSVKETGGTFEIGKVPVDFGKLIGSTFVDVNGSTLSQGRVAGSASTPADYTAALAGMEIGDVITYAFSAEYAPDVEYGTVNMEGRFMVREALNSNGGRQGRVDTSAVKFQD